MEIRIFAHSWLSDWNHGNAHFLRGLARALVRRGHRLRLYESLPSAWGDWSLSHLIRCEPLRAGAAIQQFRAAYPELDVRFFVPPAPRGAHLVAIPAWGRSRNGLHAAGALGHGMTRAEAQLTATALEALDATHADSLAGDDFYASWTEAHPAQWLTGGGEAGGLDSPDFPFLDGDLHGLAQQLDAEVRGADVVLVHEWNAPELIDTLLELRRRHRYLLLLHDTHHRAASQPGELSRLPLQQLDGILVFGESLKRLYEQRFGLKRLYVFHEAADVEQFYPIAGEGPRWDLVWIGNWGDGERTRELEEYLLRPAARLQPRPMLAHGVRYPTEAIAQLRAAGIRYGGYLPNLDAPAVYGASQLTVHIPRSPYTDGLGGIPTIRVFEALACGCPLLTSPWSDEEGLFTAGRDFLVAANGREMTALMLDLLNAPNWRQQLGAQGRATILQRHTCSHRAQQLEEICHTLA